MNLRAISRVFRLAQFSGPPTIFWGPPGTGKTRFIEGEITQLSELVVKQGLAKGWHILTLIPALREPADFNGLPIVVRQVDGTRPSTLMAPPQWAQQAAEWAEAEYYVTVFMDEMSNAAPSVQSACLRGIQDGIWGDIVLPKDRVRYCAAANPPAEASSGWDLSAPMANRYLHLEFPNDPQAWVEGMTSGWPNDGEIPFHVRQMRIHVATFVRHRPQLLHQMPKDEAQRGMAWPSNRTWTETADLLAESRKGGEDEEVEASIVSGLVGSGPGMEFLGWERALDLPDPEDVLKHPDEWKWPGRGDQQFAILTSVAQAVISKPTKERVAAAWKAFAYAAKKGGRDVSAIAVKALAVAHTTKFKSYPLPAKELDEYEPLLREAGLIK